MKNSEDNIEKIGNLAATLALIEIGMGSLLHAFKIPLAGHFLSLNQIAFLSRSCFSLNSKKAALEISVVASLLKSLSPAGKKLTPMLAIASQGVLYYLGIGLFGLNYLGLFFSSVLSSSWAFLQPVLFIYLLFGKTSLAVAEHFLSEMQKVFPWSGTFLLWTVLGFFILKCAFAFFASIFFINLSEENFKKYETKMLLEIRQKEKSAPKTALHGALLDILNPLFLFSFLLTALFFIFSNSSFAQMIWGLLRPLALSLILFYCLRTYPLTKLSAFLGRKGLKRIEKMVNFAVKKMSGKRDI